MEGLSEKEVVGLRVGLGEDSLGLWVGRCCDRGTGVGLAALVSIFVLHISKRRRRKEEESVFKLKTWI